jgi:hypothetical protein
MGSMLLVTRFAVERGDSDAPRVQPAKSRQIASNQKRLDILINA